MRILWIPFIPRSSNAWEGSRHFHLLRQLRDHEIHLVAWDRIGAGPSIPQFHSGVHVHQPRILPRYWAMWNRDNPRRLDPWLNERILGNQVKRIVRQTNPDAILVSSSHYATGHVPLPQGIPVVLDHVDEMPSWVAKKYFNRSDAIATVSPTLYQNAVGHCPRVEIIENGVDVERYSAESRQEAKARLGLQDRTVVSLIGLTCSSRLYFLEAFEKFARQVPNAVLLLVGDCQFTEELKRVDGDIRAIGPVPYDSVADYFNATDIGLYPGDNTPYYREAHPLKIVEYTAAGCQVISSPVEAFLSGWPNVQISDDNSDSFCEAMLKAVDAPRSIRDVSDMSWKAKAHSLENLIRETLAENDAKVRTHPTEEPAIA